jgi:hypothetical protein
MSIIAMAKVLKSRAGSTSKKAVLLAMADAANDDGSGIWKSSETIADQAEVSKRTVLSVWSELEAEGVLVRDGERRVRGGIVIIWNINLDALTSSKPDANASPGEIDDINPMQILHEPGETVSPKPSLNHPLEPSNKVCSVESDTFEEAWNLYNTAPLKARQTKKPAKDAWNVAIKKCPPNRLLDAIRSEIDLQHERKGRKEFCPSLPDMHRWLKQERWADVQQAAEADSKTDWLEFSFRMLAENGDWPGAQYGHPIDPRSPKAEYPDRLYKQFGVTRYIATSQERGAA